MQLRNSGSKMKKITVIGLLIFAIISGLYVAAIAYSESNIRYYPLSQPQLIIARGPAGTFDHTRTHTLSVVELNKNGFRFWGYYTGNNQRINSDMGIAYSNDLKSWVKDTAPPVLQNLRWGTVVVVDGVVNMFGTRNYGGDTKIVRLTSEDGKTFQEQETVVPSASGEKHQNPFIFYDENNGLYRLYYFHLAGQDNRIEEKHSSDISQLSNAPVSLVMSDSENILAAPSVFYRDGRYWFTTETLRVIDGIKTWETLAFVSDKPLEGYEPVDNSKILINDDACYFPYIFDNELNGLYSHRNADGTWDMYRTTYSFETKNQIILNGSSEIAVGKTAPLTANLIQPDGDVINVTSKATWATSENSIATVCRGEITAKKAGSVVITVSYGGASATRNITILPY